MAQHPVEASDGYYVSDDLKRALTEAERRVAVLREHGPSLDADADVYLGADLAILGDRLACIATRRAEQILSAPLLDDPARSVLLRVSIDAALDLVGIAELALRLRSKEGRK